MRLEQRSLSWLALPLKALFDRFAVAALIVVSLALLLVGKADPALLGAVGNRVSDVIVPALGVVVEPINASRRAGKQVAS